MNESIKLAKSILENGDLVAIPTETVYGLAGNAFDEKAILKIFETKKRPTFDPLIVHCANIVKLKKCAIEFPTWAEKLATAFMPGAITLLLKKNPKISDLVTSGSQKVALRIPKHALALELLNLLDFPLAAPSANPFGYISPTSAAHVSAQLGDKISLILDGGDCQIGVESTIVGEEDGEIIIYRKGGIAVEAIQNILGKVRIFENSSSNPQAPGMLKSHYAPKVNFVIGKPQDFMTTYPKNEIGYIAFAHYSPFLPENQQLILSTQSSTSEAASHLFAYMREMDSDKFKIIVAELVPEEGLGAAVNDRLKRAAAK